MGHISIRFRKYVDDLMQLYESIECRKTVIIILNIRNKSSWPGLSDASLVLPRFKQLLVDSASEIKLSLQVLWKN